MILECVLQDSGSQDGNLCVAQKAQVPAAHKATFKIHEDKCFENTGAVSKQTSEVGNGKAKVDLPAHITTLHRPPLAVIENKFEEIYEEEYEEQDVGSPMSLDKSGITSPEKQDSEKSARMMMLDVDEYRDEIYLYLRETEVCYICAWKSSPSWIPL